MLYRKLDRSVVAMQDACPHRLLPLSMGIKEGDNIRCRYHGLLIGSDGVALQMPLKSDPPGLGAKVKRLLGMDPGNDADNSKRNEFNRKLMETYRGEAIFDLAGDMS